MKGTICTLELDEAKVKQFNDAIDSSYWFEFFIGMCFVVDAISLLFCDLYLQKYLLLHFLFSYFIEIIIKTICLYGVST